MRLTLISDIHANLEALDATLADIALQVDRIVCLGDIVGYNRDAPNASLAYAAPAAYVSPATTISPSAGELPRRTSAKPPYVR